MLLLLGLPSYAEHEGSVHAGGPLLPGPDVVQQHVGQPRLHVGVPGPRLVVGATSAPLTRWGSWL